MKPQKNTTIRITRALLAISLFAAFATMVSATDYTWTTTGTTGHDWTGANAKWTPAGAPSETTDNAAFSNLSTSTTVNLNTNVSINNLSVAGTGGTTLTLRAANDTRTLNINGTLSKSANTNHVVFISDGASTLSVTAGNLSLNTGTYRFGGTTSSATNTTALSSLAIGAVTMNTNSGSSAIDIDLNIASDYRLGTVTFSGGGTNVRTINLINNTTAAQTRTATINGLTQTTGTAAVITGSKAAVATTGTHAATLKIDTAADTTFTATTQLTDGIGGTLALLKTGAGTQKLTGTLSHTGGTTVEAGTLAVSGTLAPSGDLTVLADATFAAANALTVHDVTLASSAILGFDLDAATFPTLTIGGDLLLKNATGPATFTIDFGNTGVFDQTYAALLSIAGTGVTNDFAGATLSYKNFGASKQSGTLSFDQLTNGFSIAAAAVPEPATCAAWLGILALAACLTLRKRPARQNDLPRLNPI
ncbi:autotransporter-associated beta strand repeat-containing protein [Geminisphaera colitermitum]|uniref:autotransporter-associated beta strand repeat-containing protein n=1 Tax=Geminisphaera colitermitum TaxID=1148786 RepID=UPI000158C8D4|nr:autotransporter-associated beta strand repeat-containing protein [Geminisphaera colitermitum]